MNPKPWQKENDALRIVLNGGLGDHLLMSPFVRFFRQNLGYKKIHCVVHQNSLQLFDRNPHIDKVIPCEGHDLFIWGMPEQGFDVFCPYVHVPDIENIHDLRHIKSEYIFSFNRVRKPVVQQVAEFYDLPLDNPSLEIFTALEDERWAKEYLSPWQEKKFIYLNTASALESKNYPLHLWQETVNLLHDTLGSKVILLEFPGNQGRLSGTEPLPLVPTLRQSAALFHRLSLIITVDSFPGHLAAATKTPAIVLFGPSNPTAFGHPNNTDIRLENCEVCANTPRRDQCQHPKCLEEIPPHTITAHALKILKA